MPCPEPTPLAPIPRAGLRVALALSLLPILGVGCTDVPERTGDPKVDLKSADAHVKVIAAQEAARRRDPATIPQLIDLLGDEEKWVRYNAHVALNVIAGPKEEFGYNYLAPPKQRSAAIQKYREWYEKTGGVDPPRPVTP